MHAQRVYWFSERFVAMVRLTCGTISTFLLRKARWCFARQFRCLTNANTLSARLHHECEHFACLALRHYSSQLSSKQLDSQQWHVSPVARPTEWPRYISTIVLCQWSILSETGNIVLASLICALYRRLPHCWCQPMYYCIPWQSHQALPGRNGSRRDMWCVPLSADTNATQFAW